MDNSPAKAPHPTPSRQTVRTVSRDVAEADIGAAEGILSALDGRRAEWIP